MIFAVFSFSLGANEKLLKAVPQECNIVIGMKVNDLLKLPIIKENLKNIPQTSEDTNIKPESVKGIVIGLKAHSEMELTALGQQPKMFMALETNVPIKLNDALKMVSGNDVKITKKQYLNKEYHEGVSNGETFGIYQISDTLFIMGTTELLHKGMAVNINNDKNLLDNAIMKKLIKTDGGVLYAGGYMNESPDFKGFSLLASYNKGIKLNSRVYCKKAEKATELAMQGNAFIPMLTANPQMGIKPEHIKISAKGSSLSAALFVPENTLKQIPMMLQNMFAPQMEEIK